MTSTNGPAGSPVRRQRADARRNYESLVTAAHDAFADDGSAASLEDIARRAGVGIGTLYRHFPTRRDLFEAVYVHEVNELCRSAQDVVAREPWDALTTWLHRFVEYSATKRAVIEELAKESELLQNCRADIVAAGRPLLERAQAASKARPDVTFDDVLQLVMGVTYMQMGEPAERRQHLLGVALDGIRSQPSR